MKRVKITLMRRVARGHDLSVQFGILPTTQAAFQEVLTEFLVSAEEIETRIETEEILDAETHEASDLLIKLHGDQMHLIHLFQQRADRFIDNSEWSI